MELTESVMEDIKPHIVDAVVFAGKGPFETCGIFEQLLPDLARKEHYILRDISIPSAPEFSLNLCSDALIPYWVEKFKLGIPLLQQEFTKEFARLTSWRKNCGTEVVKNAV